MDLALIPLIRRDGTVIAHAQVDQGDYPKVAGYTWRLSTSAISRTAYAVRWSGDKGRTPVFLHNEILGVKGVDHIDGDGLNNTRLNLRPATHAQNMQNRRKHRNGSSSPERGVYFHKQRRMWRAQVKHNGKCIFQRNFRNHESAVVAVREARRQLFPFATN